MRTDAVPHTSEDDKLFQTMWIYASRHGMIELEEAAKMQGNPEWEGVTGSLISATIEANLH